MSAFQCRKNHKKIVNISQDMAHIMNKGQEAFKLENQQSLTIKHNKRPNIVKLSQINIFKHNLLPSIKL